MTYSISSNEYTNNHSIKDDELTLKRLKHSDEIPFFSKRQRRCPTQSKVEEFDISKYFPFHLGDHSTTPSIAPGKVVVEFAEGEKAVYEIYQLCLRFDFFRKLFSHDCLETNTQVVKLQNFEKSLFEVILELVVGKRNILDLISDESFDNPDLYEDLEGIILYLMPRVNEKIESTLLSRIKEEQLPFMKLELAQRICLAYERQMFRNYHTNMGLSSPPIAVKIAQKRILQTACITNKKAETFFRDLKYLFSKRRQLEKEVTRLNSLLLEVSNIDPTLQSVHYQYLDINIEINKVRKRLSICLNQITGINSQITPQVTMMERSNLVEYVRNPNNRADSGMRLRAAIAERELKEYRITILDALTKSGADMEREDLLEYLVGPKAYLLDAYGIEYSPGRFNSDQYCFRGKDVLMQMSGFGYALDDDGPYSLENRILKNAFLWNFMENKPHCDRIVKNNTFTVPVSKRPEVVALRAKIMPILDVWPVATDEERTMVKQLLIDFNGWSHLEITPEDIVITEKQTNRLFGYIRHKFQTFHVNFGNFYLIIKGNERWKSEEVVKTILQSAPSAQFPTYVASPGY